MTQINMCHLWILYSVKHNSDSDSEVMLCAVKQSRRVVVDLYRPDRDAIARANVDTTAKRTGKSRLGFSERRARTRGYRNASEVIEIHAGTTIRNADEGVSERLERPLIRVIFDLHASEKVEET